MTLTPTELIANAMVDVSTYDTELRDGKLVAVGTALRERVAELVADGDGLALCHGVAGLLAAHGLDIHSEADAAVARDYLESVFRDFVASVDVASHSPVVMGYDQVAAMDVDGYNKNTSFTPNSDHTESREFLTTKCVHFDAATTFIGNVYGPNTNISGGRPIICDTRDFLAKTGIAPGELIELMPHGSTSRSSRSTRRRSSPTTPPRSRSTCSRTWSWWCSTTRWTAAWRTPVAHRRSPTRPSRASGRCATSSCSSRTAPTWAPGTATTAWTCPK